MTHVETIQLVVNIIGIDFKNVRERCNIIS